MVTHLAANERGFTVVELLVVMSIIIVLAGLILGTSSFVQKKGSRSRAEAEIAALSAAIENYKADNGIYPRDTTNQSTDTLDARTSGNPTTYKAASLYLYTQLSPVDAVGKAVAGAKGYFTFKPQMLDGTKDASGNINPVLSLRDPFGNSYGYSTAYQADLDNPPPVNPPTHGYNPTFDLWSTAGEVTATPNAVLWIKNW